MRTVHVDTLLVWDTDKQIDSSIDCTIMYWQNYNALQSHGVYSISQLVEKNSFQLRSQYLALIYELGESRIDEKRVLEYLKIRPSFSYWWMTLLAEKCNFAKSPQIDNVIKLMMFEKWIDNKNYKQITHVSSNSYLVKAISNLACELGIDFKWQKIKKEKSSKNIIKRIFNSLPSTFQAVVWLGYHLVTFWSLKGVGVDEWKNTKAKTTFVSYFFNLTSESLNNGCFESRYWANLPNLLDENHVKSNWLHIYVKGAQIPNSLVARNLIKQFNSHHASEQTHVTLHSFLSAGLILSVLRDWYRLVKMANPLNDMFKRSVKVYWPLFEKDYYSSMSGFIAMGNVLYLKLFEEAMSELPQQERGIYLQENQGWEFSFIYSWRNENHGDVLIGVPHTPPKFWDLRSYYDPRSYDKSAKYNLPTPDYVGINGISAKKMYLEGGYPKLEIIELEALRYLYLNRKYNKRSNLIIKEGRKNNILVLGDYLEENTTQQMVLLQKASSCLEDGIRYLVKPHPACPIYAKNYPELDMLVTNKPISEIINQCSLVYTSSATSAAVDAYCAGKIVLTLLDSKKLNLSPLKGNDGVFFISTPNEFANIVNKSECIKHKERVQTNFLYTNPELPKWKGLLINYDQGTH